MALLKAGRQRTGAGEDEETEPSAWGGDVNGAAALETGGGWFLRRLNTGFPHDPVIPFWGVFPEELKPETQREIRAPTFAAASLTNSRRVEAARVSTHGRPQNDRACPHAGILLSLHRKLRARSNTRSPEDLH